MSISHILWETCADPDSFVRGGPTLTTFFYLVDEGRKDLNTTLNVQSLDPPAKRHLNGVLLACRWWPNIEFWLGSLVIFQENWTSIAKKPYFFVIFQGGSGPPVPPPPLDPHMRESIACELSACHMKYQAFLWFLPLSPNVETFAISR